MQRKKMSAHLTKTIVRHHKAECREAGGHPSATGKICVFRVGAGNFRIEDRTRAWRHDPDVYRVVTFPIPSKDVSL
jgi:hypothetical protein